MWLLDQLDDTYDWITQLQMTPVNDWHRYPFEILAYWYWQLFKLGDVEL